MAKPPSDSPAEDRESTYDSGDVSVTPEPGRLRIGAQPEDVVTGSGAATLPNLTTRAGARPDPPPAAEPAPLRSNEVDRGPSDADERLLSATTAAVLRGDPKTMVLQTQDVQRRLRRLSDDPKQTPNVRLSARNAEASLAMVLALLDGEVSAEAATPTVRSMKLFLDLTELGLSTTSPALFVFKAVRLIVEYAAEWKGIQLNER